MYNYVTLLAYNFIDSFSNFDPVPTLRHVWMIYSDISVYCMGIVSGISAYYHVSFLLVEANQAAFWNWHCHQSRSIQRTDHIRQQIPKFCEEHI